MVWYEHLLIVLEELVIVVLVVVVVVEVVVEDFRKLCTKETEWLFLFGMNTS